MLKQYIKSYLDENYFGLSEDQILRMNERTNDCALNNVIVHLNEHCYGLIVDDDGLDENYSLFYINNCDILSGSICRMNIRDGYRNEITFALSSLISKDYPLSTDLFETFNTYQRFTRSAFEKLNYFTYGDDVPKEGTMLIKGKKGAIYLPTRSKLEAIKEILQIEKCDPTETPNRDNWIYLMFNTRNDQTKIGHSIQPSKRERTLQGEDPQTELLAAWLAPKSKELKLHHKYERKRTRGEWFKLSVSDIVEINRSMKPYYAAHS